MAVRGAPIAREDRLDLQTMESRFPLTPWLYNTLVFEAREDTSPPERTGHPAFELHPPEPPRSHYGSSGLVESIFSDRGVF